MENNRILVVDDDPMILETYHEILGAPTTLTALQQGADLFGDDPAARESWPGRRFDVVSLENGQKAAAAVAESIRAERPFAAAFVDMRMPGIDGAETARRMWDADPDLHVVAVTAYGEITPDDIRRLTGRDDVFYLRKPFKAMEIQQFACCLTTQWNLRRERNRMADQLRQANDGLEALVAVRTRKLHRNQEKLENALGGTIQALTATVESRDPYTAGHQRRVANLACAISDRMGLSPERKEAIRMTAAIHDIGKIAVPSETLNRPGRINSTEFALIRAHPEAGYDILKNIDFPWPVAEIELQHHERLDGSGYPQGLKDGQIRVEARVIAVADVVEAMLSHRPYRPAVGIEATLAEIESGKGVKYDPAAVDACAGLIGRESDPKNLFRSYAHTPAAHNPQSPEPETRNRKG